jgi:antitoxin component of MazEF toxin-antitoxin module
MDFNYKKYSLENLEKWVEDALNSAEASPQEIYDCIRKVVEENYYCYKNQTSRCYELLALLNGNGKGHIPAYDEYLEKKENLVCDKEDPSPECKKSWSSFWEENYYPEEYKGSSVSSVMPPWGHSDMEALKYTDEELNAMCDKAASDQLPPQQEYLGWKNVSSNEFDKMFPKKDKVVKWQLPVEVDGASGEFFVCFPDDLLEAANFKEGDQIEWIDQGDGSYLLKKVEKQMTYDEAIAAGWEMTADGFWIKAS